VSFRVDPAAIRVYAAQFTGHADDAHVMHDYIATYASFGWHEQGLINMLRSAHERFAGEVTRALGHLHDLLNRSRTELEGVAAFYERTDQATAGHLDGTYQLVPHPSRQDTK
jgi:NADH:ubiquinone oxidoreductase subunit E